MVQAILHRLGFGGTPALIELVDEAPLLFEALSRASLHGQAAAVVEAVETAELVVVGSPVYRASYTGALKHLFDLVDHRALQGTPVVLAATGGSPLHGLMIEHQLRPLFGFFGALTMPTTVYATEADFEGHRLASAAVEARIERVVAEARRQVGVEAQRAPSLRRAAVA